MHILKQIQRRVRQLSNGQWAGFVTSCSGEYYKQTVSDSFQEAYVKLLRHEGQVINTDLDDITDELVKLGAVSESDPRSYLC